MVWPLWFALLTAVASRPAPSAFRTPSKPIRPRMVEALGIEPRSDVPSTSFNAGSLIWRAGFETDCGCAL